MNIRERETEMAIDVDLSILAEMRVGRFISWDEGEKTDVLIR